MVYGFGITTAKTECLLNGKIVKYDACSSKSSLEEAKEFYSKFTYIGSGKTLYIDDVKNVFDKTYHFFIRNF
jgi:hypothetical protein